METMLQNLFSALAIPKMLIEQISGIPEFVKLSLIESLYFVPIFFILYLIIEVIEQFFMKHTKLLIDLIKKAGVVFGLLFSVIPECGFSVIASAYYSRKMITRGVLLAFFISCSDEALPMLFLNPSKTDVVVPLIIIKLLIGLIVWAIVDFPIIFMKKAVEEPNAVNVDLNEDGCCHHKITSIDEPASCFGHPITHTCHITLFVFIALALFYSASASCGGSEAVANLMFKNAPAVQAVCCAIFGLIPNCAASVFLAVAYAKGLLSFAGLLAGLITTTGVGLLTLAKTNRERNADTFFITLILLVVGIFVGIVASAMPVPSFPLFTAQ